MEWNWNIDDAPRSKIVERVIVLSDGKTRTVTDLDVKRVITASKCGKVIVTHWLPEQQRWLGYHTDERPIAWQPYPEHPGTPPITEQGRGQ